MVAILAAFGLLGVAGIHRFVLGDVGKGILIPLDGSPRSESIIPYALEIARLWDAQVLFLRVLDRHEVGWMESPPPDEPYDAEFIVVATEWQTTPAQTYLQAVSDQYRSSGESFELLARVGLPAQTILAVASEENVDLIVMASHGRSGLKRFALGSVTYEVLHGSHRPVLFRSESAVEHGVTAALNRE